MKLLGKFLLAFGLLATLFNQAAEAGSTSPPLSATQIVNSGGVLSKDLPCRMKFEGRNYGGITVNGTTSPYLDSSATGRAQYTTAGIISRIQLGYVTRQASGNALGEGGSAIPAEIGRATIEDSSGNLRNVLAGGKSDLWIPPSASNSIVLSDVTGFRMSAATSFYIRQFFRTAIKPTGASGSAVAGGNLTAASYIYNLTVVDQINDQTIESGPTADTTVTTSGSNLTAQLTWTAPAYGKWINIYRTAGGGATGTSKFLAQVPISQTSFADIGALLTNANIAPPTQTAISMGRIALLNESGNTPDGGSGNGSDQTQTTGTITGVSLNTNVYIPTPSFVLADDCKNPSILGLGDSIMAGVGLRGTAGPNSYPQGNWFDTGLPAGQYAGSLNLGMSSTLLKDIFSGSAPANLRLGAIQYTNYVIDEYGHNDIYTGGLTWQQVAANKLLLAQICYGQGVRYFTTTLTPTTVSTDSYITVTNQSIANATFESARENFNTWVRTGFLVDGSGNPVLTGGTPSKYIYGYFDLAAPVEVNASNVVTPNGMYWLAPTTPDYTGQVLTGTPTTTAFAVSGTPYPAPTGTGVGLPTKAIQMTSGTQNGKTATISTNTTSGLTLYANGSTALTGLGMVGLTAAPAAGDTYSIWSPYTPDGVHETQVGHALDGSAFGVWGAQNFKPYGAMLN